MDTIKKIFWAFTRTERFVFFGASLAGSIGLLALLVIAVQARTMVVPTQGGEFTEGMVGQPIYVNPILAANEVDKALVRLLFANVPDLAEKIEADKNGRVWTVRLKENLLWSDGEKITTDDIVFTVEKIQESETQSPLFLSWQGVTAARVSELEMQFNLVNPYPFFLDNLKALFPIPQHLFSQTPSANWRLSEYNLKPVGSGPYLFASYEKQPSGFVKTYRVNANPDYSGKTAFLENIVVTFFGNMDALVVDFNKGAVDGFGDMNQESLSNLKRSYQIHEFHLPSYYAVFINQGQNLALKEKEVRIALDMTAQRSALIKTVFDDRGTPVTSPVIDPGHPDDTSFESPENASALLENAGWHIRDNVREKMIKNTPIKLEFDLVVPHIGFLTETASLLKASWEKIGARVNIISVSPQELIQKTIKNREYQAVLFGNFLNPLFDLYSFWHSNERFYPGLNLSLYSSKPVDQLIENIRRNFDPESRKKQLETLKSTIRTDMPAIFLYSPDYTYIASKDLKGVQAGFIEEPSNRFLDVNEWYLKAARTLK